MNAMNDWPVRPDWPARPDVKAPLERTAAEARNSSATTPPVEPGTPTHMAAGGVLLTLALIIAAPVTLFACAWLLIELMTRLPLLIVGAVLVVAGALVWSLCGAASKPFTVEPDCYLDSPLWRFKR